jgi:hypothetical protein
VIVCSKCGVHNKDETEFCGGCRAYLDFTGQKVAEGPRTALNASLSEAQLSVDPGAEAGAEIRVRNNGSVVDRANLVVLGIVSAWATVEPSTISLFPKQDGVARIRFRPPRTSQTPAGPVPFAVQATSQTDNRTTYVANGSIEVHPFYELATKLTPVTSRGRRLTVHSLAITNRGNTPVEIAVTAADPDDALECSLESAALSVEPGATGAVALHVETRKRFAWGPARPHPFHVRAESAGVPPLTADGMMVQQGLIPYGLRTAALVASSLLAVVVVLASLLLPHVLTRSTAAVAATPTPATAPPTQVGPPPGGVIGQPSRVRSTNDACKAGFVWREAGPSDQVCVTGQTRAQVLADNTLANFRRNPSGGPYGPDTCLSPFVWRDAFVGDHVCVTELVRQQTEYDNNQATMRTGA